MKFVPKSKARTCDFRLPLYMPIFHRLQDITIYWSKIYGFRRVYSPRSRLKPS